MGFLKTLFGGREESPEEKAEKRREREFDVLKYDGVRARKMGEVKYAIRCFREALALRNDTETASYLPKLCSPTNKLKKPGAFWQNWPKNCRTISVYGWPWPVPMK